jgi:hypothetical protein
MGASGQDMAWQGKFAPAAVAGFALAVLSAGCQVSAPPEVWATGGMVLLTDRSTQAFDPIVYDAQTRTVRLQAAGNETSGFHLVIDAPEQGGSDLSISWTDLSGGAATVKQANIRAFRCLPVEITALPAWYAVLVTDNKPAIIYDALLPLEAGRTVSLPAGQRMVVWFDVSAPADTDAGVYTAKLIVQSPIQVLWSGQVRLEVLDFALPAPLPLPAIGGIDHQEVSAAMVTRDGKPFQPVQLDPKQAEAGQVLAAMRQMIRLGRQHGLEIFETQLRPLLKRDRTGAVRLDWTDYDAAVGPYLDGSAFDDGLAVAAWPMPFSDLWPPPRRYGGPSSPEYVRTLAAVQAACNEHFAKSPAAAEAMFAWLQPAAEGQSPDDLAASIRRVRRGNPRIPVLCQLPTEPSDASGETEIPAEIIAVPGEHVARGGLPKAAGGSHPLAGTWLMPGEGLQAPCVGLMASASDVCALAWIASMHRCRGLFLPSVIHWSGDTFRAAAEGETQLFYPGRPVGSREVLASLRLKWLRFGLQDAACLEILRRYRGELAGSIISAMVGATGAGDARQRPCPWSQDPMAWEMARRLVAREVEAALKPAKEDNPPLRQQRQAWKKYFEQAHPPAVERTDCRVRLDPDKGVIRADATLDFSNPLSRPASISAAWGELPDGWRAGPAPEPATVSPGGRQLVSLTAQSRLAPQGAAAKARLPIALNIDGQEPRNILVIVPVLLAGTARRPPVVDGALDDWPMLEGNTAGDFQRIPRRGEQTPSAAKRATQAFALCDSSNLYLGIRCDEPNLAGMTAAAGNTVRYAHGLACGEDLVEIILDAGGAAKTPADLYYIVVKPNGAMLAQRGIAAVVATGKAEAWACGATVAVGRQPQAWVVEMAIPLASFGHPTGVLKQRAWKANFVRFATQGNEASCWAPVERNFYEIDKLGALVLPPFPQAPNAASVDRP